MKILEFIQAHSVTCNEWGKLSQLLIATRLAKMQRQLAPQRFFGNTKAHGGSRGEEETSEGSEARRIQSVRRTGEETHTGSQGRSRSADCEAEEVKAEKIK